MTPADRLRAGLKNAVAVLAGLVVAWILAELLLTLVLPPPLRYVEPQAQHDPDPVLGWRVRPLQHTHTIDKDVTTDSHGFRSPEPRAVKDSTDFRVLCLGDSHTFGNGTAQDATFSARLQARLADAMRHRTVEVMNAGTQGYDTVQEVGLFAREAPDVQPDVAVIAFYLNDLGEVLRRDIVGMVDPVTHQFHRGGLKRNTPYALIYLIKQSRVITLVSWQLRQRAARSREDENGLVLLGETPAEYARSWRIVASALARADSLSRARRIRLIVFPVPTGHEFVKDYPHEQYRSRFMALADSLGLEAFDPTPVMMSENKTFRHWFITWDGHINSATHDLISRMLAARILEGTNAGR